MSYKVWNGRLPRYKPVPGEWYCNQCMFQDVRSAFITTDGSLQCPECEGVDVFDAWNEPVKHRLVPAPIMRLPAGGMRYCFTCGLVAPPEDFVNHGGAVFGPEFRCYACDSYDQPGDAVKQWYEQFADFTERGISYDPVKGWYVEEDEFEEVQGGHEPSKG